MCYLRGRFVEQIADIFGKTYLGDTGAFYFDNIEAEDVKMFLLKQAYTSFLFLSETMNFFVYLAVSSKPSSQPIWLKV